MSNHHDVYGELFSATQRLLPQHTLSRLISLLAEAKTPWLKNLLIKQFIRTYSINMDDPASTALEDYPTFNAFFTRALKPESRPISNKPNSIISPADGFISQVGKINNDQLIQAKGINYSARKLLGSDTSVFGSFDNGEFMTIYLSPKDYHRVHIPVEGNLLFSRYIPGKLFSVNQATTENIANLFTRNERLVTIFETPVGKCALVMVGAMLVAGISSAWHGRYKAETFLERDHQPENIRLNKGEEIGQFYFGSTVILMFEPQETEILNTELALKDVQMGESISYLTSGKVA